MNLDRLEFKLQTIAQTPLHIGSGEEPFKADGSDSLPVQRVERGIDDLPIIPGSTLKGWLRAQHLAASGGDEHAPDFVENFGRIGDKAEGRASRLALYGALATEAGKLSVDRAQPFGAYSYTAAHNAIDRETGAVDSNRLFACEYVSPGTEFEFQGSLKLDRSIASTEEAITSLADVLAPFGKPFRLGANGKLGSGELLAVEVVEAKRVRFDATELQFVTEDIEPSELQKQLSSSSKTWVSDRRKILAEWECDLKSDEAFIVANPDHEDPKNPTRIYPLKTDEGHPVLPASSLRGVLRSEAQWALEVALLNDQANELQVPLSRRPLGRHGVDDRFLDDALPSHSVTRTEDLAELTSVERLFGVPGWKALVEVSAPVSTRSTYTVVMHNIAIDRLTMGALTGAKWETEVFMGAGFSFSLKLIVSEGRGAIWQKYAEADLAFLQKLADDVLPLSGLCLGGHSSVGYGEFAFHAQSVPTVMEGTDA